MDIVVETEIAVVEAEIMETEAAEIEKEVEIEAEAEIEAVEVETIEVKTSFVLFFKTLSQIFNFKSLIFNLKYKI